MANQVFMFLDVSTGKVELIGTCGFCHGYTEHASLALVAENKPKLCCDNCTGAAAVAGVTIYKPAVISWVPQQPEHTVIKATETIYRPK